MPVKLDALIKRTEAAITSETDPKKRVALQARLSAYAVAKADSDGDDDGDGDKPKPDDGDGDDDEAAKHAENARKLKAKAKALGHRAKAAEHKQKASESEEEAKKCEEEAKGAEEDDEEAKAMLSADERAALAGSPRAATLPAPSSGADPTVVALVAAVRELSTETTKLKTEGDANRRSNLMARAARYVPKHILAPIAASATLATLEAIVSEAEKGQPMVHTTEGDLLVPKAVTPGTEAALSKETLAMIDSAVANCGAADPKAFRATLVTAHLKAHTDRLNDALNGAPGRI